MLQSGEISVALPRALRFFTAVERALSKETPYRSRAHQLGGLNFGSVERAVVSAKARGRARVLSVTTEPSGRSKDFRVSGKTVKLFNEGTPEQQNQAYLGVAGKISNFLKDVGRTKKS